MPVQVIRGGANTHARHSGDSGMRFEHDVTHSKGLCISLFLAIAFVFVAPVVQVKAEDRVKAEDPVKAEDFDGPTFRKGMWHFVRTIELVLHEKAKQRLLEREMTRCVDPTNAMKATFASPSIGNCISAKAERSNNKYRFSNRCDYMGPVRTVITVHSDESYTESNELTVGALPKTELVVARRIGDCPDESQTSDASPVLLH
jgi:hypothetical protein